MEAALMDFVLMEAALLLLLLRLPAAIYENTQLVTRVAAPFKFNIYVY
jgi:hypothetical protein